MPTNQREGHIVQGKHCARLIGSHRDELDGVQSDGIAVCMTDMGDRFRLIVAKIELIKQPEEMPKLPVARIM